MFNIFNNKGALKRHLSLFLILGIIISIGIIAYSMALPTNQYTINGNSVEWENDYGKIVVTPHTINGVEGCLNVTVKNYMQTQDLDCALIANSNKIQLTSSEYLTTTFQNVTHSFTCNTNNFYYTTSPKWATCLENNGTVLFNDSFESGNLPSKTVYWNILTSTDAWNNIPSNKITKLNYNSRDVYAVADINFATNTEKTIRVCGGAVSKFDTEKFDVGCKRSVDTWGDVISSGNYIIVDPTWNYTEQVTATEQDNSCSSAYFSDSALRGYKFTVNRNNVSITNITIHNNCHPFKVYLYLASANPATDSPIYTYTLNGNEKTISFNYTLNNSVVYRIQGGGTTYNENYTTQYRNGDGGCSPLAYPIQATPYATVDGASHWNVNQWTDGSNAYCFNALTFANSSILPDSPETANETTAREKIVLGIINSISGAQVYTNQQIYVRYLNGTQIIGTFDKVAVYGNQRWAFNFITGNDAYTRMSNLEPSLYIWENTSLLTTEVQSQVETLINSTLVA